MKDELWEIHYNSEEDGDLYAISIVDNPANKLQFIALKDIENKEDFKVQLSSDKKRKILYGIVLRADQKIYREKKNGDPFYISFNKETIVKLSQDYFKKGYQNNSTYNHEDETKLSSATVVENWIVENKDIDKAVHLGLDVEEGDWVIGMKLGDKEWEEYVESGKAKGFSIDSFLNLKKVQMETEDKSGHQQIKKGDKNISKKRMSLVKQFLKLLSSFKLAEAEVDGKTLTAEAFEEGNVVYSEDGEIFVGEFVYDGKTIKTDSEGVIVSVVDAEVELEGEKPAEDEKPTDTDTPKEEVADKVEDAADKVEDAVEELKKEIEDLTVKLDAEKANNVELKSIKMKMEKELEELKSKPIVTSVRSNPIQLAGKGNMTRLQVIESLVKNNKNK